MAKLNIKAIAAANEHNIGFRRPMPNEMWHETGKKPVG
jgi:hypothetical protein